MSSYHLLVVILLSFGFPTMWIATGGHRQQHYILYNYKCRHHRRASYRLKEKDNLIALCLNRRSNGC